MDKPRAQAATALPPATDTPGAASSPSHDDAGPTQAHGKPDAGDALSGVRQVVELADGLSEVADRLNERLHEEIRRHDGAAVPETVQAAMRTLFDDEMLLRQHANTLYADAAAHVIAGLGQPQARLVGLTADAAGKIRRIGTIAEATSLVGGVLALAGAVAGGHAGHVLLALEKIRFHNAALDALAPPA